MRHLSTTECAKEIRTILKAAFRNTKFSVKSKCYSGGSSITVNWIDGPTTAQVNPIVKRFEGADFDGMIDLKSYNGPSLFNGEPVTFGVDYVFTNRNTSHARNLEIASIVCRKLGADLTPEAAIDSNMLVCGYLDIDSFDPAAQFGFSAAEVLKRTYFCIGGQQTWLSSFIHRVSWAISFEFSAPPEALPQDVDSVLASIEALCC